MPTTVLLGNIKNPLEQYISDIFVFDYGVEWKMKVNIEYNYVNADRLEYL